MDSLATSTRIVAVHLFVKLATAAALQLEQLVTAIGSAAVVELVAMEYATVELVYPVLGHSRRCRCSAIVHKLATHALPSIVALQVPAQAVHVAILLEILVVARHNVARLRNATMALATVLHLDSNAFTILSVAEVTLYATTVYAAQ